MIKLSKPNNNSFTIFDYKNEIKLTFEIINTDEIIISCEKEDSNNNIVEIDNNNKFIDLLESTYLKLNNIDFNINLSKKYVYPNNIYIFEIKEIDNIIIRKENYLFFKTYFDLINNVVKLDLINYELVIEDWNLYKENKNIWFDKELNKKNNLIKCNTSNIESSLSYLKRYSNYISYSKEIMAIIKEIENSVNILENSIVDIDNLYQQKIKKIAIKNKI